MSIQLPHGWANLSLGDDSDFKKGIFRQYASANDGITAEENDCLMVWDGARSGLVGKSVVGIIGSTLMRIKPKASSPEYFYYFLKSQYNFINGNTKGTGIPHVDPAKLWSIQYPFPPINEQIRISNKLDNLITKVDAVQARLERIPSLLKRFRQSVLAAATSGELTLAWKSEYGDSSNWSLRALGDVASVFTGVTPLKKEASYYDGGSIPWLTSSATGLNLVTKAENYVTKKAVKECRLKVFKPGTLLIAMYGEGKTRGQVTEIAIEATINQACAAVIVNEDLALNQYVKLCIEANYAKTRMMAEGGNQPNLNLSKVRSITINLPNKQEQTEIVRRVESLFSLADSVEKQYLEAKKRTDCLTQSLLVKAFRGELVPQDPNDEPASELLKKIQAQRSLQSATKPSRKTTTTSKKQKKVVMKLHEAHEHYLLDILTQLDGEADAKVLWNKTELGIDDFYAKLKQEMQTGGIIDDRASSDPTQRKLKLA